MAAPRRVGGGRGAGAAAVLGSSRRTRKTRIGRDDVLDALLAEILERDVEPVADLIADRARDADAAGLGELLQARGDVDAVAEDVVVLDDHVAEIDADAELDPRAGGTSALRRAMRRWISTAHCTASATLWNSTSMPSPVVLMMPALVLGDRRVDQLEPVRLEARERARLVGLHQPAVADHVGRQDRREPALDWGLVHEPNLAGDAGDDKPPEPEKALPQRAPWHPRRPSPRHCPCRMSDCTPGVTSSFRATCSCISGRIAEMF